MKKKAIFICGVNGVGKSTLIPQLKLLLSERVYVIHDFDERGVPDNAGREWRASETSYWLERAEQGANKDLITVICGFVKPVDFGEAIKDIGSTIRCVLLDANPDAIRSRLTKRYTEDGIFNPNQIIVGKTVNEFIDGNIYIRKQLKKDFENLHCPVIDTSDLMPAEVAERIIKLFSKFSN